MLMIHRKTKHPATVAPCQKYSKGECNFTSSSCWWSHDTKIDESPGVTCFICSKNFRNKIEVMNHRKSNHPSSIETCNKFLKGDCPFQDKFCWYEHRSKPNVNLEDIDSENLENSSVFHEVTKTAKPPIKA